MKATASHFKRIMDAEPPSPRLLHLLSRLADGLLDPAEAQELDAMLLADPEARAYYRCHAAVHLALGSASEAGNKVVAMPAMPRARRWPAFAAAAALVLAAGTAWWSLRDPGTQPPPLADKSETARPILAVTFATGDLRWNLDQAATTGQQLGPGIVRVQQGTVSLSLVGGQTVHLKSPAEFELLDHGEFALRRGPAAFRTIGGKAPFIVHLPKGALVDSGSEFSVDVGADGTGEVRVFENQLTASTIGSSGRTLEELQVKVGKSVLVNSRLSTGNRPSAEFLRVAPPPLASPPGGEEAYAKSVLASSPTAYWRFERTDGERRIADETGRHPLQLQEKARLSGSGSHQFLVTNDSDASGFAVTLEGLDGLDTEQGVTVECLLFSSSEGYGTALAFELADPSSPHAQIRRGLQHAPQSFTLERMGRKGEHVGHIHPDFALRTMFRSPPGYIGGSNLYSRESHLLHRWIHVAAVHAGTHIRLYVDGTLSDEAEVDQPFLNSRLRPIIGRLQPHPKDELRQWIGGIDEVALYGRALSAEEIRAHVAALKP
jgi:ferric-dicitrate binding protein FerR (iron transport regulator)